jgi:hypothetical protein
MPVLVFGVGGTGTKIIKNIHSKWIREYGYLPDDIGLAVIDARKTPEGGPIQDVVFKSNQFFDYEKEWEDSKREINNWWPYPSRPHFTVDFSDGCGATKGNGRFFLYRTIDHITETVDALFGKITAAHPQNVNDSKYEVFIVGSLGNGTGGGTFMDIANIVKSRIVTNNNKVTCVGIFLPGSVTKHGNNAGIIRKRVAANGFASLLEIQCEFNRRNRKNAGILVPQQGRYVFTDFNGANYYPGDQNVSDDVPPIDLALVMENINRKGQQHLYPSLITIASEALFSLVSGIDSSDRGLDQVVHTPDGRMFGSFSALRVLVPKKLIFENVCSEYANKVINNMINNDSDCCELLVEQDVSGRTIIREDETSLSKSVDVFMKDVLKIKETDSSANGSADTNQLFDRFSKDDYILEEQLVRYESEIDEAKNNEELRNSTEELVSFVQENTEGLAKFRNKLLFEDSGSLWLRKPLDSKESIADAGTKWLIMNRVSKFVDAGAFALLKDWLCELQNLVEYNRKSIDIFERKEYLGSADSLDIDFNASLNDIQKEADRLFGNILSRLGGNKKIEDLCHKIRKDCNRQFKFKIWHSKINAVDIFYRQVIQLLGELQKATDLCIANYNNDVISKYFLKINKDSASKLDDSSKAINRAQGVSSEWFIGGDLATRKMIVQKLINENSTSLMAIQKKLNCRGLFEESLLEVTDNLPERAVDGWSKYEKLKDGLSKAIQENCKHAISSYCDIDSVLEEEAVYFIDYYIDTHIISSDVIDDSDKQKIAREIKENISDEFFQRIIRLKWRRSIEDSRKEAIDLYISGKINNYVQYCVPQWNPEINDKNNNYVPFSYFSYSSKSTRIGRCFSLLGDGNTKKMQLIPDDLKPKNQIDIMVMETGGRFEDFRLGEDKNDYIEVMAQDDFCPHVTSYYKNVGLEYLDSIEERHLIAGILGLAEMLDYVESSASGFYKTKKQIKGKMIDGGVLWPEVQRGHRIGRGLEQTIRQLKDLDNQQLVTALKHYIYEELREIATSKTSWEAVVGMINRKAANVAASATREQDHSRQTTLRHMAKELTQTAAELEQAREKTLIFN